MVSLGCYPLWSIIINFLIYKVFFEIIEIVSLPFCTKTACLNIFFRLKQVNNNCKCKHRRNTVVISKPWLKIKS